MTTPDKEIKIFKLRSPRFSRTFLKVRRKCETNSVMIDIERIDIVDKPDYTRNWHIVMEYDIFKKTIIDVALAVLKKYGLPFDDNTFDCVTVAYGVRNFEHLDQGYLEMYRVLRPGGVLCVIELSTPTSPIVKPFYRLYTRFIIPTMGRMVSKDVRAYSYLPESIAAVPQGNDMLRLMQDAGFVDCRFKALTFGTCTIYTAYAPR